MNENHTYYKLLLYTITSLSDICQKPQYQACLYPFIVINGVAFSFNWILEKIPYNVVNEIDNKLTLNFKWDGLIPQCRKIEKSSVTWYANGFICWHKKLISENRNCLQTEYQHSKIKYIARNPNILDFRISDITFFVKSFVFCCNDFPQIYVKPFIVSIANHLLLSSVMRGIPVHVSWFIIMEILLLHWSTYHTCLCIIVRKNTIFWVMNRVCFAQT